jgi:hypothetical protein
MSVHLFMCAAELGIRIKAFQFNTEKTKLIPSSSLENTWKGGFVIKSSNHSYTWVGQEQTSY